MAIEIRLPKLYDKQQEIYDNRKKFNLIIISRRWGKTTMSKRLVIEPAIRQPGYLAAWSAPKWKYMLAEFEKHAEILEPLTERLHREERTIKLTNKSILEYWSSDDPGAGRSRKYNRWVSDETQQQRELEVFISGSVIPTLLDLRGDLWALGTANGEGSELHTLYNRALTQPDLWQVASGRIEDNPYMDPEEIKILRSAYANNKDLEAQEFDSQWIRIDGVAPLIRKSAWDDLYGTKEDSSTSRVLALDASTKSDTTAIISVWLDKNSDIYYSDIEDIICIEPEAEGEEVDFMELENTIYRMWLTGKYSWFAYDPSQAILLAQRLRMKGVRCFEFTQNNMRNKADSYLRQVLNENRYHHPGSPELTEHILNATLKYNGEAVRLVKPQASKKIDLAVALSMALYTYFLKGPSLLQDYKPQVAGNRSPNLILPATTPFFDLGKFSPRK